MKALVNFASLAVVLTAAVLASGFTLDAAVILSVTFAAGIGTMFIGDYSRTPRYNLDPVKVPARRVRAERRASATPEFASLIIFNTTCV